MGKKNRSKKFERQEKSKVKLKKKELLPKGQNITDINFKVKKIVIREQLKSKDLAEPLSRRKLNVQELLTRLQHHNATMRKDALEGLDELVTDHQSEILTGVHLPHLIENVTRLSLDTESSVRKKALNLIASVLKQATEVQIAPQVEVLLSYLCCAMTHLSRSIQEDSLLFLDALLEACPSLVVSRSHTVLSRFFDLISRRRVDSQPGRLLTLNLGSKLTSIRWRIQVLTRLHMLVKALFESSVAEKQKQQNILVFSDQYYYPAFNQIKHEVCVLPSILQKCFSNSDTIREEVQKLQGYVEVLMPLLFETWMEVAPKQSGDDETCLNEESAALLHCILGVMTYMWKYLRSWEEKHGECGTITLWFSQKYAEDLKRHLLADFPYSTNAVAPSDKRQRGERRKNLELAAKAGLGVSVDGNCWRQNLALCYLAACLLRPRDYSETQVVQSYAKGFLSSDTVESSELLPLFEEMLLGAASKWENSEEVLNAVVTSSGRDLVKLLCDVVMKPKLTYWHGSSLFKKWITELPIQLCNDFVSHKTIQALHHLVCQDNPIVLEALRLCLPFIIRKLPSIVVTGTENVEEAQRDIVHLIYWVRDNDPSVKDLIEEEVWDQSKYRQLKEYLIQVTEL